LICEASGCRSDSLVTLVEPVVQKHAAPLTEQQFAFLLDAYGEPFGFADLEGVRFGEGFIEETDAVPDFLLVDPDAELPEQLVERVFDEVSFQIADFERKFHDSLPASSANGLPLFPPPSKTPRYFEGIRLFPRLGWGDGWKAPWYCTQFGQRLGRPLPLPVHWWAED
jgi:hypothetical protein